MNKDVIVSRFLTIMLIVLVIGFLYGAWTMDSKPDRPGRYLMLGTAFVTAVVGGSVVNIHRKAFIVHEKILKNGIDGQAKILNSVQTGMRLNNQPFFKLTLEVTIPSKAPYVVTKKMMVPLANLALIQTGATVPVKVDKNNPEKVELNTWA